MRVINELHARKTLECVQAEIDVRQKELTQLTVTRDSLLELFGEDVPDVNLDGIEKPKPKAKPAKVKAKPMVVDVRRKPAAAVSAVSQAPAAQMPVAPKSPPRSLAR